MTIRKGDKYLNTGNNITKLTQHEASPVTYLTNIELHR